MSQDDGFSSRYDPHPDDGPSNAGEGAGGARIQGIQGVSVEPSSQRHRILQL